MKLSILRVIRQLKYEKTVIKRKSGLKYRNFLYLCNLKKTNLTNEKFYPTPCLQFAFAWVVVW